MSIIVPNCGEVAAARLILNQPLTLRLYGNNVVPNELSTAASFTEIIAGGYEEQILTYENWNFDLFGIARYLPIDFIFSSVVSGPGSVYGYYILNAAGTLLWVERFPTSILPFVPIIGSLIRVTPRIRVT